MKLAGTTHSRNGNVWHNSDDVSVWELTGFLLASRSEFCVVWPLGKKENVQTFRARLSLFVEAPCIHSST